MARRPTSNRCVTFEESLVSSYTLPPFRNALTRSPPREEFSNIGLIWPLSPAENIVRGLNRLGEYTPVSHRAELCACEGATTTRSREMSALIDDVSRIVASPIPRRRALRLVSGVVAGGILTSLGLGRASRTLGAQVNTCTDGQVQCGATCCYGDEMCCGGTCYGAAVSASYSCCGGELCRKESEQCCTNHCCRKTQTCCGLQCCSAGRACCHGQCCAPRAVCCGNTCCPEGHLCCQSRCVATRPSASSPCSA